MPPASAPPVASTSSPDVASEAPSHRGGASGSVRDLATIDLELRPLPPPGSDPLLPAPKAKTPQKLPLQPMAGGGYRYDDPTFSARIEADGTLVLRDKGPQIDVSPGSIRPGLGVEPMIIEPPSISVSIDVTDVVMRLAGDDPYYHRKLTFVRETLELRVELAKAACQERLTEALYTLKSDLQQIWDDRTIPLSVRRRHIFQIWDDCADDTDDQKIAGYADQARATVMAFIQDQLPANSAYAYPEPELVALNRRRKSKALFDPYGSLPWPEMR